MNSEAATEPMTGTTPDTFSETGTMKNSKDYGIKIDKFFRAVKTGQKLKPFEVDDPIDAMVFGLIAEHTTEKLAKKVFKSIQTHFVDYNDLRVCRAEEIQELLEDPSEKGELIASNLTRVLSKIFDKYDALSLKGIDEQGKRQAKKELDDLGVVTRFAVDFCILAAFDGHAIPMTETMLAFLRAEEMIDPDATTEEVESFLLRHIPASSGWEFYELLRQAAESGGKKSAPAKAAAKADKKKTAAKSKNGDKKQ
jgi:endonuclease III